MYCPSLLTTTYIWDLPHEGKESEEKIEAWDAQ